MFVSGKHSQGRTRLQSAVMMRAQIHLESYYLISAPSEVYTVYGKNIKVGEYTVQYSDLKHAPAILGASCFLVFKQKITYVTTELLLVQ